MHFECKRFLIYYPNPSGADGSKIRDRVERGRASLRYFLGDDQRRRRFFEGCVNDERIVAIGSDEGMIGYAAFFLKGRGPLSPGFSRFISEYGLLKGLGNFLLFRATEPRICASTLYIYNIHVQSRHRGMGAGGALLDAVLELATSMGCRSVKLQVAAHNRAMLLYLRKGFVVTGAMKTRWFRRFFPFDCLVNMELRLDTKANPLPVMAAETAAAAV